MSAPFFSNVASVGFASGIAAVTIAGLNFSLAALLTPLAFGHFSVVFAVVSILILTGKLGMQTVIVRFGTEYLNNNDSSSFSALQKRTLLNVICASFLSSLAAFTYIDFWGKIDLIENIAFSACIVLYSLAGWCQGLFEARGRFGLAIYVCRVMPFLFTIGFTFWRFNVSGTAGILDVAVGLLLGFSAAIGFSVAYAATQSKAKSLRKVSSVLSRQWLFLGISVMTVALVQTSSRFLDLFVLDFFHSAEDVAVYALTARVSEIVAFGVSACNVVVASAIARVGQFNEIALRPIFAKSFLATFGIATLMGAAVIPLFAWVLPIFTDIYSLSLEPLIILVSGQVVAAFCGPVLFIFVSLGYKRELMTYAALGLALNFIVSIILVPNFGVIGAAIATATGIVTLALSLLVRLSILVGTNPPIAALRWVAKLGSR